MQRIDASTLDLKTKLVSVNRVAKTVKGGRNMRFSALVVVGDENGHVGCGMGKAAEIPEAIRKAEDAAKRSMIEVPFDGTTIPHEVIGAFSRGRIHMMPAKEGTGVLAGGHARAVLELAGIKDIRTKAIRSNNPCNVVKATIQGLTSLRNAQQVAELRGKTVKEILG